MPRLHLMKLTSLSASASHGLASRQQVMRRGRTRSGLLPAALSAWHRRASALFRQNGLLYKNIGCSCQSTGRPCTTLSVGWCHLCDLQGAHTNCHDAEKHLVVQEEWNLHSQRAPDKTDCACLCALFDPVKHSQDRAGHRRAVTTGDFVESATRGGTGVTICCQCPECRTQRFPAHHDNHPSDRRHMRHRGKVNGFHTAAAWRCPAP